MGKQPERGPKDGPVSVNRAGEGRLVISAANTGEEPRSIEMSEYNAWRVFGSLALMLDIKLPPALGKAIKF